MLVKIEIYNIFSHHSKSNSMKRFFALVFALVALCNGTVTSSSLEKPEETFKIETDKIFDKLVQIRRKLHQYPELAGNEKQTQETIKQYLLELGLEVKTDIYGYGLVGILKGAKEGKSVAWRADMDALPQDFPDNVDFKSKTPGVRHGCGHDVHLAIALGIAEMLAKQKQSLQGTIYFIFQPAEETFVGAKGMVNNKLFSLINPSEIYGLHITPASLGQIFVKANEMYSYQKGVKIEFNNTMPKEAVKPLVTKFRTTLTRAATNSKPWEVQRILDPNEGLFNPNSIFKDYFIVDDMTFLSRSDGDKLVVYLDVYETDKAKLPNIIPALKKVIADEGLADKLVSVTFFKENPTVDNDPNLTKNAVTTLNNLYGNGAVSLMYGQVPFSNDDFSYFQQKVPGVYFFLGGSNFEKGVIANIHAPNFMVDEECMRIGVKSFSTLLYKRLSEK
jgi:metal-dependent amidase/aminoacylase/carboxypeptidase family protein